MDWSHYQNNVFDFAANGDGNGSVISVAGSGKSTVGVAMVKLFNPCLQGLFTSFTRSIVETLQQKIKDERIANIKSQTYNSFGAGLIWKYMSHKPKLLKDYPGQKTDTILRYDILGNPEDLTVYYKSKQPIIRLVALFKNLAILDTVEAASRLDEIIEYYDVEIPNDEKFKELLLDTYHLCLKRTDVIDYDDQKLFPLLFNWPIPQVDFLVIDEYQDTCPLESELMLRACQNGRIVVIGDPDQAIYSFKGTKPDSMGLFSNKYAAKHLPLSICYRCPRAVISEAKKIVPHIEPGPNAVDGAVRFYEREVFFRLCRDHDMVISRCTEDIVKSVIKFIGDGRAAYVQGQEYGTQLKYFVEKHSNSQSMLSTTDFMNAVNAYFNEHHPRLISHGKESQAIALESKVNTVSVIAVSCATVQDLKNRIDSIFTTNGNGIQHMTIHKSKGLEGHKQGDVHVLRCDKLPHPRAKKPHLIAEELRLKYVAITRTRNSLNYVLKSKDET